MGVTHYRGSADGDIETYLRESRSQGIVCPTFQGYEPFEQLWNLELVVPHTTLIRLMFNTGRCDEHYTVVDKEHIEGFVDTVHQGLQGIHNTKELLSKTDANYWEIDGLRPEVFW